MVQFVLTATVMYHTMVLDIPPWAIKAIEKILRGFLWRGCKDAKGGHCLIARPKVARPKELGGLGISDLKQLNCILGVRWLWLQKAELDKPWASVPIQSSACAKALLSMAVATEIGDGRNTLFWSDRWIMGQRIAIISPLISSMILKRTANRRTIADAFANQAWVQDIHGVATVEVIIEFLQLWDLITEVDLQPGVNDNHFWCLTSSGRYSARSAYEALFQGYILFSPW